MATLQEKIIQHAKNQEDLKLNNNNKIKQAKKIMRIEILQLSNMDFKIIIKSFF
jgi:hypothetical protein